MSIARIPANSHTIQITTIRINGDNFLPWSQSVRMYIRGQGKIGYLTGDKVAPSKDDSSFATWDAENSMVMTWLVNSMVEDISCFDICYYEVNMGWFDVDVFRFAHSINQESEK